MQGKGNGVQSGTPRSTAVGYLSEVPLAGCCSWCTWRMVDASRRVSRPFLCLGACVLHISDFDCPKIDQCSHQILKFLNVA